MQAGLLVPVMSLRAFNIITTAINTITTIITTLSFIAIIIFITTTTPTTTSYYCNDVAFRAQDFRLFRGDGRQCVGSMGSVT